MSDKPSTETPFPNAAPTTNDNQPVDHATGPSNDPAPQNEEVKASDRADAGASDQVKAEQATDVEDGVATPAPVGGIAAPALDGVQRRDIIAQAFNQVEQVVQTVVGHLNVHEDLDEVVDHLRKAQSVLGDVLGLEKDNQGNFSAGGAAANPSLVGQTTAQAEASNTDK